MQNRDKAFFWKIVLISFISQLSIYLKPIIKRSAVFFPIKTIVCAKHY